MRFTGVIFVALMMQLSCAQSIRGASYCFYIFEYTYCILRTNTCVIPIPVLY